MLSYFVFLVLSVLLAWMAYERKKNNRTWLIGLFLVMALFAGLRSAEVGTDTSGYASGFEEMRYEQRNLEEEGSGALLEEPGYYYLQKWLGSYSNEYVVLLIGTAAIFCFFVLYSVKRNSVAPVISLFVFITLGYYTFVFNAARQGLALSIYMIAIPFLIEKRIRPYVLCVLCAAMFHKTIVIALPLYYVFTLKYSIKSIAIVISGGLLVGYFLPALLTFGSTLEDRYALYVEGNASGGEMLTVFYVILAVFFILQRNKMKPQSLAYYDVYLHMLLVGSTIYLVVTLTQSYVELTRFAAYFQIASIFLWAMLMRERKTKLNPLIFAVAIIGHLGFFAIFLTKMANLVPYMWNPLLYKYF